MAEEKADKEEEEVSEAIDLVEEVLVAEIDQAEDLVDSAEEAVEDPVDSAAEEDLEEITLTVQEKCTKQFVLNAKKNAKFLSSQHKENQFFVKIVSKNTRNTNS